MDATTGPPLAIFIFVAHAGVTWFMCGLIWVIQLVHYPLMACADRADFPAFEKRHQLRIGWIVAPMMLAELCLAALTAFIATGPNRPLAGIGLGLLFASWASTAFLQVPCHRQLESGFDARAHHRLVQTNWLRTIAWSARAVIASTMVWVGVWSTPA